MTLRNALPRMHVLHVVVPFQSWATQPSELQGGVQLVVRLPLLSHPGIGTKGFQHLIAFPDGLNGKLNSNKQSGQGACKIVRGKTSLNVPSGCKSRLPLRRYMLFSHWEQQSLSISLLPRHPKSLADALATGW